MNFDAEKFTDSTELNVAGEVSTINKGDAYVKITAQKPTETILSSFADLYIPIVKGEISIIGMSSQAEIELFKYLGEMLDVFNVKDVSDNNIEKVKTEEDYHDGSVAWFDARMDKEAGDDLAKNKKGDYKTFVGTYEQIGRGININIKEITGSPGKMWMISPALSGSVLACLWTLMISSSRTSFVGSVTSPLYSEAQPARAYCSTGP